MDEQKKAKVPEGMTIDRPIKDEDKPRRSGIDIPDFKLDASLPTIIYPHYTNNARTELACILVRPDGMSVQEQGIPRDEKHPLYNDIRKQYTEQEIDHNTQREINIQKAKQEDGALKEKEQARDKKRADLWARKSTFLDLPVVRNTKYKSLKRKLRQATNPEEALAYGVAIIVKETDVDE